MESLPTEDSGYSCGDIRNGWFSGEQRRKSSITCYLPVKHFKIEVRKVEDGLGRMEVVVILHTHSSFPTVQHSCLHHLASLSAEHRLGLESSELRATVSSVQLCGLGK